MNSNLLKGRAHKNFKTAITPADGKNDYLKMNRIFSGLNDFKKNKLQRKLKNVIEKKGEE